MRSEPEDRKVNGLRHFQPQSLPHRRVHTRAWGDRATPQLVVALRLFRDNGGRERTPDVWTRRQETSAGATGGRMQDTVSIAKPCKRATNASFQATIRTREPGLTGRTSSLSKTGPRGGASFYGDHRLRLPDLAFRSLPLSATDFKRRSCFGTGLGQGAGSRPLSCSRSKSARAHPQAATLRLAGPAPWRAASASSARRSTSSRRAAREARSRLGLVLRCTRCPPRQGSNGIARTLRRNWHDLGSEARNDRYSVLRSRGGVRGEGADAQQSHRRSSLSPQEPQCSSARRSRLGRCPFWIVEPSDPEDAPRSPGAMRLPSVTGDLSAL